MGCPVAGIPMDAARRGGPVLKLHPGASHPRESFRAERDLRFRALQALGASLELARVRSHASA
jgi:hypothetical protein